MSTEETGPVPRFDDDTAEMTLHLDSSASSQPAGQEPGPPAQPSAPARHPAPRSPGTARPRPRGGVRARRWATRTAIVLAGLLTVLAVLFGAVWFATPGVGDARQRTAAMLAGHGGHSDDGVPPARVAAAIVATEDSRFYAHHGLDAKGIARGLVTFSGGGALSGATIDAQLAKLLYTGDRDSVRHTAEKSVLAVKLDAAYSKRQLMAMYLDAAYFGHGGYGVVDASHIYFGLSPAKLSWAQASMLAGLVWAPSALDPTAHLAFAKQRQRHVLDRLAATGTLTEAQADAAYIAPLDPAIPFRG